MKRNTKILIGLAALAVIMFAFGFANVPLFKMFCSAIGIGLSPDADAREKAEKVEVDYSRPLKVNFTTTVNDDLPILFESEKKSSSIHVGESDRNVYHFVNLSDDTLYFRPVHSVFPAAASKKYTMLECFCFRDMTLLPREDVSVPLVYYFNNKLGKDITRVTMHYTLFKREKDDTELPKELEFNVENKQDAE